MQQLHILHYTFLFTAAQIWSTAR